MNGYVEDVMSNGSSSEPIQTRDSGALATPGVGFGPPQRELRLVVEGVRQWLIGLDTGRAPTTRLGVITGNSGAGQQETLAAVRDGSRRLGVRVIHITCSPPVIASGACGDLVRQLLAITEGETDEKHHGFARDVYLELRKIFPGGDDRRGHLLPSLGWPLDRVRLVDAVSRALLDVSARAPLVVIWDNFKDADPLTREVFAQTVRMLCLRKGQPSLPRLFMMVSVPADDSLDSLVTNFQQEFKALTAFTVKARGYARDDLRYVARGLLGDELPLSLREQVLRATAGNVRLILWLLRDWRDSGEKRSVRQRVRSLGSSFAQIVRNRYGQSSKTLQQLIQTLAILGGAFPLPVVFASAALDDVETDGEGEATEPEERLLKERGLMQQLVESGWAIGSDRVSPEMPLAESSNWYGIADLEVAEIILQEMPYSERQSAHLRVAEALSSFPTFDVSWSPQVLYHLVSAEADLTARPEALDYLRTVVSPFDALDLLHEVLQGPTGAPLRRTTQWQLVEGELLEVTDQVGAAIDVYQSLRDRCEDPGERARYGRKIGRLFGSLGQWDDALREFDSALKELDGKKSRLERLKLLVALAQAQLEVQKFDDCRKLVEECCAIVESEGLNSDDDYLEVLRLALEVSAGADGKESGQEREFYRLERRRECSDVAGCFQSLTRIAQLAKQQRDWEAATGYLSEALDVAISSGSRTMVAQAQRSLGILWKERNDYALALEHLQEARTVFHELADDSMVHNLNGLLMILELQGGRLGAAGESAKIVAETWPDAQTQDNRRCWPRSGAERAELVADLTGRLASRRAAEGIDTRVLLPELLFDVGELNSAADYCLQIAKDGAGLDRTTVGGSGAASLLTLGRIQALRGQFDDGLRSIHRSLKEQGRQPDRQTLLSAYNEAAAIYLERADLTRAYRYSVRGLHLALDYQLLGSTSHALEGLTKFFADCGVPKIALTFGYVALELSDFDEDPRLELRLRRLLSFLEELHGRESECDVHMERMRKLAHLVDLPVETCRMQLDSGWIHCLRQEFDEALCLARQGIEMARSMGLHTVLDSLLHLIGTIDSAVANPRKNVIRALDVLEQALHGAEAHRRPRLRWQVLQAIGSIYSARGNEDIAQGYLARAGEVEAVVFGVLPPELSALSWHHPADRQLSGARR